MRQPAVVLLDVEGTTTPVQFVYDILFPYARAGLSQFLRHHQHDPTLHEDIQAFRQQARLDRAAGLGVPEIPGPEAPLDDVLSAVEASALLQMDGDRKVGALKSLQGKIWEYGYRLGELKGQVFDDVPSFFAASQERGITLAIYSSGSVLAQKLLFGYSDHGDLCPALAAYFDTAVGSKKEAESYREIARQLGVDPSRGVFATDILAEARAAQEGGWQAVILDRPGNVPQPSHSFPVLRDLMPLLGAPPG